MDEKRGEILLPLDQIRMLYDLAVGSMDFGSGFMDDEEVDLLRTFAERLSLDPMAATPSTFRRKYPHSFKPGAYLKDRLTGLTYHSEAARTEQAEALVKRLAREKARQKREDAKHNKELAKLGVVFNDPQKPRRKAVGPKPEPEVGDLWRPCEWCGEPKEAPIHGQ